MSPAAFSIETPLAVQATVDRIWASFGERVRGARIAKRWTTQRLAGEAGVSRSVVYLVERGDSTSLETAARIASALQLRLELTLSDGRRATSVERSTDPVHSAMGEAQARVLRSFGYTVNLDEPYQHYQFAGRADVAAWDVGIRALLHLENRTAYPDMQSMAGSWNAKRAYLAESLAGRLGIRRWESVTHVMVSLWSAEVLHALRLRPETFRSLCPDKPDGFAQWWSGTPPASGITSSLVVFDPLAAGRQRTWIGLEEAQSVRPRVRGYPEAAERLRHAGRA